MLGRLIILCSLLVFCGQAAALTIYKYVDKNGVVTYSDQAAPGAQVFVFNDRMVERLDNQVKLETKKHEAGETLLIRNDLYAPVEIELKLEQVQNAEGRYVECDSGGAFLWIPWDDAPPQFAPPVVAAAG